MAAGVESSFIAAIGNHHPLRQSISPAALSTSPRRHSYRIRCSLIGSVSRTPFSHHLCPYSPHDFTYSGACSSSFHDLFLCASTSIQPSKRAATVVAFAVAGSDQTFPSKDEDGEGSVGCCRSNERKVPRSPSPDVEPGDVVRAQLEALKEKDFATVFEFASPKNKSHTGPLPRFTEMIQGRAYNIMLGHASAEILSSLFISPERFQQRVLIKGADDRQTIFAWSLSKQEAEPYRGCWMTDYVHRDE